MRQNTLVLRTIAAKAKIGAEFTALQLKAAAKLVSGKDWSLDSLLPADHAGILVNGKLTKPASQSEQRADYIFEKVSTGVFRTVSPSAMTANPAKSSGSRNVSPEQAMSEARALLGIPEPTKTADNKAGPAPTK